MDNILIIDFKKETETKFDTNLNALSSFMKEEVDIKIESLKIELDNMRERMWKKVDGHTETIKTKMQTKEKLDEAKAEFLKLYAYLKE